ncbi:hypothetical protein AVEN_268041-1 [Araneus ventricosus]|uniref:Uncharacterized protein n=1 Tax=Araneus ventricosus TaxID=182803 RepID=A0A4Y2BD12_ARAVE|nr:hypothetical protein AVEN_268041-1 [Araneus ventricosus]
MHQTRLHVGSPTESGFEPGTLRPLGRDLATRPPRPKNVWILMRIRMTVDLVEEVPRELLDFLFNFINFRSRMHCSSQWSSSSPRCSEAEDQAEKKASRWIAPCGADNLALFRWLRRSQSLMVCDFRLWG